MKEFEGAKILDGGNNPDMEGGRRRKHRKSKRGSKHHKRGSKYHKRGSKHHKRGGFTQSMLSQLAVPAGLFLTQKLMHHKKNGKSMKMKRKPSRRRRR